MPFTTEGINDLFSAGTSPSNGHISKVSLPSLWNMFALNLILKKRSQRIQNKKYEVKFSSWSNKKLHILVFYWTSVPVPSNERACLYHVLITFFVLSCFKHWQNEQNLSPLKTFPALSHALETLRFRVLKWSGMSPASAHSLLSARGTIDTKNKEICFKS